MDYAIYGLAVAFALILSIMIFKKCWPEVYKDDNKAEEFLEQVLEDTTGVKVDLTPGSPTTPETK